MYPPERLAVWTASDEGKDDTREKGMNHTYTHPVSPHKDTGPVDGITNGCSSCSSEVGSCGLRDKFADPAGLCHSIANGHRDITVRRIFPVLKTSVLSYRCATIHGASGQPRGEDACFEFETELGNNADMVGAVGTTSEKPLQRQ
jgi:hypothetical protein